MFAGKKSAQIREILISESAWEEMTCLFAPSLTDHTVSSVGHNFYRAFSDKWDSTYTGNITINERPSARWGSWITITANQTVIYQTFLFPTKIDFDKNVALALAQSEDAINRLQIDKALLSTRDLAKDEF